MDRDDRVPVPLVGEKRGQAVNGQLEATGAVVVDRALTAPTPVSTLAIAASSHGLDQRHVDDVLGDKPDLQFVGANHVADQQIIRPLIASIGGATGHGARFLQHYFSRPLGGLGISVVSATSWAIATLTPPSS